MNLEELINEIDRGFRLTDKEVDPETGSVSHKVVYEPIHDLRREVEELSDAFKRTLKAHPEDDKLDQFYDIYMSFKRKFKTHVNRKYGR